MQNYYATSSTYDLVIQHLLSVTFLLYNKKPGLSTRFLLNVYFGIFGVSFNEVAAGRYLVAHQHGEHMVSVGG